MWCKSRSCPVRNAQQSHKLIIAAVDPTLPSCCHPHNCVLLTAVLQMMPPFVRATPALCSPVQTTCCATNEPLPHLPLAALLRCYQSLLAAQHVHRGKCLHQLRRRIRAACAWCCTATNHSYAEGIWYTCTGPSFQTHARQLLTFQRAC